MAAGHQVNDKRPKWEGGMLPSALESVSEWEAWGKVGAVYLWFKGGTEKRNG